MVKLRLLNPLVIKIHADKYYHQKYDKYVLKRQQVIMTDIIPENVEKHETHKKLDKRKKADDKIGYLGLRGSPPDDEKH